MLMRTPLSHVETVMGLLCDLLIIIWVPELAGTASW